MLKKISKNPYILAVTSAILLRLAFPKFDLWLWPSEAKPLLPSLWPLAWVAFVPLFLAIEKQKPLKAFFISFVSGALFYIAAIFWLINVTIAGMIVLSLYLGLYTGIFGLGYVFLKNKLNFWSRIFFAPALWVLFEFLRAHFLTGFPWVLLAYSQSDFLPAIQAADVFGAYGVSFIIIFVNVVVFEFIRSYRSSKSIKLQQIVVPALILLLWLAYGVFRVYENPKKSFPLKVAIVQGNIPQEVKWAQAFQGGIFKKYKLLTEIAALKTEPDLIIWPETSYPDYVTFGENDAALKDFAAKLDIPLLAGSIRLEGLRYFNSAILLSSSGKISEFYDKMHLVPFGEYIPARRFLPFIERIVPIEDFTPGRKYKIFSATGKKCPLIKFGILICFEDILAPMAARFVREGADFLVNITNDAWFGDTSSPYQHMQASVFRAVENRVFVVRAANTGISCIIDDKGRVIAQVKDSNGKQSFITGYETGLVYKTVRRGLYSKIGDVFVALCAMYIFIIIFVICKTKIKNV